jgi:hypothetical protein
MAFVRISDVVLVRRDQRGSNKNAGWVSAWVEDPQPSQNAFLGTGRSDAYRRYYFTDEEALTKFQSEIGDVVDETYITNLGGTKR